MKNIPQRHLLTLYVLIAVLGAWVLILSATAASPSALEEEGSWVCLQTTCSESEPGGELWAAENCAVVEDETGELVEACSVVIDGVEQVVRKDAINLSAIRNCLEYTCVQEVRVREANYRVDEAVIAGQ